MSADRDKLEECQIERLMTCDETAYALNISPRSVRRMVADGRLESVKIGDAVRIRARGVKALTNP